MSDSPSTGPTQIQMGDIPIVPAPPQASRREAVVYLPGMGTSTDETIEAVAHRIAVALDNSHDEPATSFIAAPLQTVQYDGGAARAATIVRRDARGDTPVVDVFEMDYRATLTRSFEAGSPLYQVIQITGALASNTGGLLSALRRKGQDFRQKLQVALAVAAGALMIVYVVMLIAAGVSTAATALKFETIPRARSAAAKPAPAAPRVTGSGQASPRRGTEPRQPGGAPGAATPAAAAPAPGTWMAVRGRASVIVGAAADWTRDAPRRFWNLLLTAGTTLQAIVVAMTAGGLLWRRSLKETMQRVSTISACTSHYLAFGEHRNELLGGMARLLDRIRSRAGVTYDRVHLVGYSFGSVVAIDAVYQDSEVNAAFDKVVSLTTIGCPADFIRTYYHDYFVNRCAPAHPVRWVNVFSPADVLASNFVTGESAGAGVHRTQKDVHGATPAATDGAVHPAAAKALAAKAAVRDHALNGAVRLREMEGAPAPAHLLRLPDEHVYFGPPAPVGLVRWVIFILKGHGFAAHNCYWGPGTSYDKTCWEELVRRLGIAREVALMPPAPTPNVPAPKPDEATATANTTVPAL
ncbi:MAG TPA: hypothetical protein VF665_04480 [Longimicrobium sp.]|jgi:hypothetical protein|uniref:hypothetical protein n=1 Tax=Longimicrobium sp. TaxID=2029185 RepID=UPI002ED7BD71